MNVPDDPYILVSFINMKLRDFYTDLDDLCKSLDINKEQLILDLKKINYSYNPKTNQFG